jgi:(p)ppGpp synthase/HD superfamily hydrolase
MKDSMALLERAMEFAVEAKRGQVDRAGVPYILHPLRTQLMRWAECPHEMSEQVAD